MNKKRAFLFSAIILITVLTTYRIFVPGNGVEKQKEQLEQAKQKASTENGDVMRISAYNAAVQFVTQTLKSPSSAQFSKSWDKTTIISNVDSLYTVQLQVDAQNSYGAMLRHTFTVNMIFNSKTNNWLLENLQ